MIGNSANKRQFSIATSKSIKIEKDKPLQERMKFTPYTSHENKFNKKKLFLFLILLMIVIAIIVRYGLNPSSETLKINENEIEKVDG
jgi:hypothetical protein